MKLLGVIGVSALMATGLSMPSMAQTQGGQSVEKQHVTGGQLGSPQTGHPATGSATSGSGMSAQSTGQYPGAVGPTGSREPDATNPVRSNPSGGGGQGGGGGSSR